MSFSLHFQDPSSNAVPSEVKEFDAASGAFDQAFVTTGSGTLDALVVAMLALMGAGRMHRSPFARAGAAR